jgi:hypothetical protein
MEKFGVPPSCYYSSIIPTIAFVALFEFGSEGLEHLSGILAIA